MGAIPKEVIVIGKNALAPEFRAPLENNGKWKVRMAPGVVEASEFMDQGSLIVLDFELDPVAPAGLLEHVQRIKGVCDIPVLLVGSRSEEASMRRGLALGADAYLIRPLDPVILQARIGELLRPGTAREPVDDRVIAPFVEATVNVFRTFVGVEIRVRRRFVKRNHRLFGDISGIMGLSGPATGSVVISLPAGLACEIVSRVLGQQPETEITDMVRDGIGEVVNMISGQASAAFENGPYRFQFGLPAVVTGHGHTIAHGAGKSLAPCLVATFETLGRQFALQVSLAPES